MYNLPSEIELGQIYRFYTLKYEYYILSQVDFGKIALVALENGSNRKSHTIEVKSIGNITHEEFKACAGIGGIDNLEYVGMANDVLKIHEDESVKFKISIGQYWKNKEDGNIYLLSFLEKRSETCSWPMEVPSDKIVLINIKNGNRFNDAMFVKNAYNISKEEWEKYIDNIPFIFCSKIAINTYEG